MTKNTLKKLQTKALDLIKYEDCVTIYELQRWLSRDMQTEGSVTLIIPGNLVLSTTASLDLVDVLTPLITGHKVHLHEPTVLEMFNYGPIPADLPQTDWPPDASYDQPHWLPAVLRLNS